MKKRVSINLLSILPALLMAGSYVTQIGQTLYDLQSNDTIGTLDLDSKYGISAVWTQGFNPTSFTDRGTGYKHGEPETAGGPSIPTSRVESIRLGWLRLALTEEGVDWLFASPCRNSTDHSLLSYVF
jgi:hypothetical protein